MKLGLPQTDEDGARRIRLGFVEFAAVVIAITAGWWLVSQLVSSEYHTFIGNQQDANKHIIALTTQVSVMNDQIATLTNQLANVPANTKAIAQLQFEYADHERRLEQLESARGVRVKGWTH